MSTERDYVALRLAGTTPADAVAQMIAENDAATGLGFRPGFDEHLLAIAGKLEAHYQDRLMYPFRIIGWELERQLWAFPGPRVVVSHRRRSPHGGMYSKSGTLHGSEQMRCADGTFVFVEDASDSGYIALRPRRGSLIHVPPEINRPIVEWQIHPNRAGEVVYRDNVHGVLDAVCELRSRYGEPPVYWRRGETVEWRVDEVNFTVTPRALPIPDVIETMQPRPQRPAPMW